MRPAFNQGDMVLLYKTNSFKNNDVIAFRHHFDDSIDSKPVLFIQRIMAMPGDTLLIESGFVIVNHVEEQKTENYLFNYHIKSKFEMDSIYKLKYNLKEGGAISGELDYSFSISEQTANELRKDSTIAFVEKKIEKSNFSDEEMYINDTVHKWNKHNFGPVYLPKKGDVLELDTSNITIYKKIIEHESRQKITIKKDSVFLDNQFITSAIIKENYYFVLGDNRDNSLDSRYWGFISEDQIIGRVTKTVYRKKK